MGVGDNGKFELEQINLDCQSFGMSSQFEKVGEMAMNSKSFFVTGWDPVVSMAEDVGFKAMPSHHQTDISPYDFGVCGSSSQLVQYPSSAGFGKLAQRWEGADHVMNHVEDCQNSDAQNLELLPEGNKRKRMLDSHAVNSHSQFESIQEEFPHAIDESLKERDEKKQKSEQSPSASSRKLISKQAKDNSKNGDAPKEEYVHVRARRGQATNSHSLAERVRREKISERMRFLQDLVPGCSKITGKAVMLDEIINYVQSLQQQVEFLSMKLATVNPESNLDIERILSEDILHTQGGRSAVPGCYPGMDAPCSQLHGSIPSEMGICSIENSRNMMKVTNAQFSSMAQIPSTWDGELQGVFQMGLVSSRPSGSLELRGKWLKSVLDNPDPNVENYLDS